MSRRLRRTLRAWCESLEDRSLLSVLTPTQVRQAYGMNAIEFSAGGQTIQGTAAGQTIAIVGAYHNPFVNIESQAFDSIYGLSNPELLQIDLAGTKTNLGWAEEEAMDVEWSHVMAPQATIIVVEAASDNTSDLMNAVNDARHLPGVSVVSMSWGGSEFRGQTSYDPIFTTPAGHTGVTFVTASGDAGSRYGANWPASSPNVVGVGGASLYVDAAGNTQQETAWSGSGGGYSVLEPEPAFQQSVQHKGRRSTPDLAMLADPNTGVPVVVLDPSSGRASLGIFGGTSLATQLLSGLIAVADQGRALAGLGTLDGPTQTLPLLYAASTADFRDITIGSNGHHATLGYDLVTGRGSPVGNLLVSELSSARVPSTVPNTKSSVKRRVSQVGIRSQISDSLMQPAIGRVSRVALASLSRFVPTQLGGSAVKVKLERFHGSMR